MRLFIQNLVTQTGRCLVMGKAAAGSIPTVWLLVELREAPSAAGNTLVLAGGAAVSAVLAVAADLLPTSCRPGKWTAPL